MKHVQCSLLLLLCCLSTSILSQTLISGKVLDKATGEALIGAQVYYPVPSAPVGTISDSQGYFELKVDRNPPFQLEASSFGYESLSISITNFDQVVEVSLPKILDENQQIMVTSTKGDEEIESASRTQQLKLRAPVSVSSLGVREIYKSPYVDYFQQLSNLKEVQVIPSSVTLGAINTRGFSDVQNWRFVQYIDGMEMNTPGLNYALGNLLGASTIDIRNIEVVSGTVSALYGANAFNGILSMQTKNPFDYKGLSVYATGGVTAQDGIDPQPFVESGVRYAWTMGNKWAAKVNFSTLQGHEWEARDSSYHLRPEVLSQKDLLLSLPQGHPNFDAVHTYGDEVTVPVDLTGDGTTTQINRTGFKERDLVDYGISTYKFNGSVHFRPNEQTEASYAFRVTEADAILRHTTVYPFVNTLSQLHKLELKGSNFFIRGYYSSEDARDSYQMLPTGAFIQEALKPSATWASEYGEAFRGEVAGVREGDHQAARAYADRDIPGPETSSFQQAHSLTLGNPDVLTGGSRFTDQSSMFHVEGAINYDSLGRNLDLQLGGSFRNYQLVSDGNLFNDGPRGFGGPINYQDFGVFTQIRQGLAQNRLMLQLAMRVDKNSNFKPRLSPRFSGVWILDDKGDHALRVVSQQGFRNPASQEGYISLDLGRVFLLGGLLDNVSNFSYALPSGEQIRGVDIVESLVTLSSLQSFLAGGQTDPSVLVAQPLSYLKQERISSIEFGYKGQLGNSVQIDVNFYNNRYRNFAQRINAYSTLTDRVFSIYTNVEETITSFGGGLSLAAQLAGGHEFATNYSFASFDADEAISNNPGFLPGFNLPEHQFKAQLSNERFIGNWGYSLNYRWSSEYVWESPFGQGTIPAYSTMDAAILSQFPRLNLRMKLGAVNFLGAYTPIYGGPDIGGQYFLTLIYGKY
ncbi:MAG: TonB-dependent receptor [Bacteroidota bacterium]